MYPVDRLLKEEEDTNRLSNLLSNALLLMVHSLSAGHWMVVWWISLLAPQRRLMKRNAKTVHLYRETMVVLRLMKIVSRALSEDTTITSQTIPKRPPKD